MLRTLFGLIYPRICVLCEAELDGDASGWVCRRCVAALPWIRSPVCARCGAPLEAGAEPRPICAVCRARRRTFDRAVSGLRYSAAARDLVQRLKYQRQLYVAPVLAEALVYAWRRFLEEATVDMIVPVPLHPRKQRQREFNQAEEIAVRSAPTIGAPVRPRVLRRLRDTQTQTDLNAAGRRANVQGAFAAAPGGGIRGADILLVDDVFTTGSTLSECATLLRKAGARRILAATAARG